MKTLVLLFHPAFQNSTVNRQMYDAIKHNPDVTARNMYATYPDFKIDVDTEQKYMEQAERIILQFPIQWYSAPALLKQWEDVIFTPGWAYMGGHALDDKEFAIAATFGAGGYEHGGSSHYTPTEILRPFQATAYRIGMQYIKPFTLTNAMRLTSAELNHKVAEYAQYVTTSQNRLGELE